MSSRDVKVDSLPVSDIDFAGLASALKALSNEKRLELLHFLTRPHYIEEIASHLKMARQAAQKHVSQLLDAGVIKKQPGQRDRGPVTEYVLAPQRLFDLNERFGKLGVLKPVEEDEDLSRTILSDTMVAPAQEARGPSLALVHGRGIGTRYHLEGDGPWTIGRDDDRFIAVDYDPFASNRHAEITLQDGAHFLVDTYSTNGTFLNWTQVPRGGRIPLRPGDVVGVGKSLLVFRDRSAPSTAP